MIVIEQIEPPHAPPSLGRECRFAARDTSPIAAEYFLEHEGVLYPQPLHSEPDGAVRLYPEAPGRYVLHARWRSSPEAGGWASKAFTVAGPPGAAPQRVSADGQSFWVPTAWDAGLIAAHERNVFPELKKVIRPGATVYDIGAYVGRFSLPFARWIGAQGRLYAVEPNPLCVYFLRANLQQAGMQNHAILPVALSDKSGDCRFSLNYGSSLIGVGDDWAGVNKPGHQIGVERITLDHLIAAFDLRGPDLIKVDVEGAEASVVAGMMGTLEKTRPHLMIELHGRQAAADTLRCLARLDYRYLLASDGSLHAACDDLLAAVPDACVQIVGYPQPQ